MAAVIGQDYAGHETLPVGVLRGAVMVMVDLARKPHTPIATGWMAASSYNPGTKSPGVVRILKDLDADIKDRYVLIVEGITDSGLILSWLGFNLWGRGRTSLNITALLRKPDTAKTTTSPRYIGFDIPDESVVNYGLDYAEKHCNLSSVGLLVPHVYEWP